MVGRQIPTAAEAEPRTATGRRYRTSDVGDVRVGWLTAGTGPPVVLLHGLAGSHRWWRETIPALASAYCVQVPELFDLRRRRRRLRPPSVPGLARLVADWLRVLGGGPVALVGHSMGGQLSLHLATAFPGLVRQLVLVGSTGIPRDVRPAELLRLGRGFLPPGAWGDPAFLPRIALDSVRAGPAGLVAALYSILTDDVRPLLPEVRIPTDVVWGELDPFVPLRYGRALAAAIPRARLHILPGAAHNPMIDRASEFNRLLLEILHRHDPAAPHA